MKIKITILAIAIIFGVAIFIYPPTVASGTAEQIIEVPKDIVIEPVEQPKKQVDKTIAKKYDNLVREYSQQYGVSYDLMDAIISCENKERDTKLQSYIRYTQKQMSDNPSWGVTVGEREKSYGLVQIHLPSNPNITYEQAIDPHFAIGFLAKEISKGHASRWSCYRKVK